MKVQPHLVTLLLIYLTLASCKKNTFEEPVIELSSYKIEEGFELTAVASEPFIEAPVAMDFDNEGRIWVVEMKGYMKSLEGLSEEMPNGTITILEDLDGDGVTDHSKTFLENLVLPRALAHVYGGLLYAEPPNLWFVEIENDTPKNKILVDSLYADGGNVEHQPNGLQLHLDNWIYNAKSNFRYQRKNGRWLKEPTSYRGQWGITKDNFGRLYYNNNSVQLLGDFVLPNTVINNPFYTPKNSINEKLTDNQRVYPLHATSVNRGYVKGVLDKDSLLINVTSACGPMIYRGDNFPIDYHQNAFVCAPEANLVKRNIITFHKDHSTAKQAWDDREFLASTDEGFRPVNLFNGPDGNMYVVDMHRGIIQDRAYLSPYLRKQLTNKKLDTIIGMGRILKVSAKNKRATKVPNLNKLNSHELVELLKNSNGWLRDRGQQLLIQQNSKKTIPLLQEMAVSPQNDIAQIHALRTLDGLNNLNFGFLHTVANRTIESTTLAHCLVLLEKFANPTHTTEMFELAEKLLQKKDSEIDLYLALSLGEWTLISSKTFFPILAEISQRYPNNPVFDEAITASLRQQEMKFLEFMEKLSLKSTENSLDTTLAMAIENAKNDRKNSIFTNQKVATDSRTAGAQLYRTICASCHGNDGAGIDDVAPPLTNSEFVNGSDTILASIILHGLSGPIHVNGVLYELNSTMPGLANNPSYNDKDIDNIISYLRNAFSTTTKKISIEEIKELRNKKPKNGHSFTEEELNTLRP